MFKNPFSFSGRIRRLEYGLSYIIFIASFFIIGIFTEAIEGSDSIIVILTIPIYWFLIAQGAKRCHDLGNSGFFQLIPFYGFVMLFGEGQHSHNKYGYNPKESDTPVIERESFQIKVVLPPGRSRMDIANEILCIVLFNTLLIAFLITYIESDGIKLFLIAISIILCYLLLLILSYKKKVVPDLKPYLFRHRLTYVVILCLCIQIYQIAFNNADLSIDTIVYGIFVILLILGITYIPFIMYTGYFKNQKDDNKINSSEIIK